MLKRGHLLVYSGHPVNPVELLFFLLHIFAAQPCSRLEHPLRLPDDLLRRAQINWAPQVYQKALDFLFL